MKLTEYRNRLNQQPTVERMTVDVDQAIEWLENNNTNSRQLSYDYVTRLAREMNIGRWQLTHQGIAFAVDGTLLDGQHRLWAIVESQTPVEMYVWRNIDRESIKSVDCGKVRRMQDVINMASQNGEVSRRRLATLRTMLGGFSDPPALSPADTSHALAVHENSLDFAIENLPQVATARGVNTASTTGVIARAYYSVDHAALRQFCDKLTSGIFDSGREDVIMLLRLHFLDNHGTSYTQRMVRHGMIERALSVWLEGENPKHLRADRTEQFPLPEEMAD